jgi:hypothetical protein
MKKWPRVALGELMAQNREYIDSHEARTYPKLSVKLYGKEVVLDALVDGSSVKMQPGISGSNSIPVKERIFRLRFALRYLRANETHRSC